ncbi:hypothetical protein QUA00_27540 [Microcoleus sp. T2B6]|uniref:hypothetical protein n=1 Tax=Microcoleus sp. T2B6 TaxID=3055424 RepID=UPI002FD0E6CF
MRYQAEPGNEYNHLGLLYEASYKSHWDSLSNRFCEALIDGIVGFERSFTRLKGNYKLEEKPQHGRSTKCVKRTATKFRCGCCCRWCGNVT